MEVLVFKTNIRSKKKARVLEPLLNSHNDIFDWSIDYEDIDNVLRIEATKKIKETEINKLIHLHGFMSEALLD